MTERVLQIRPLTLGERLAHDGRRLITRRTLEPVMLQVGRPLLSRASALPTPETSPLRRIEAPTSAPAVHPREAAADGDPLPEIIRERLRPALGQSITDLRVHHDDAADARARAHDADAVAIDSDVFFRAGQYNPHTPDGFALLAHEALHVTESARSSSSWRRSTAAGRADEERDALRVERAALPASSRRAHAAAPVRAVIPPPPAIASVVPAAAPTTPAPVCTPSGSASSRAPMTAASDRALDDGGDSAGPGVDYGEMRRALYQGLLGEMRTDFERGA